MILTASSIQLAAVTVKFIFVDKGFIAPMTIKPMKEMINNTKQSHFLFLTAKKHNVVAIIISPITSIAINATLPSTCFAGVAKTTKDNNGNALTTTVASLFFFLSNNKDK